MTETPEVEIRRNDTNNQFVFSHIKDEPGVSTSTGCPPRIVVDNVRHNNHIEINQDQLSESGMSWRFHSVCINVTDAQLIALRDFLNSIYPKDAPVKIPDNLTREDVRMRFGGHMCHGCRQYYIDARGIPENEDRCTTCRIKENESPEHDYKNFLMDKDTAKNEWEFGCGADSIQVK